MLEAVAEPLDDVGCISRAQVERGFIVRRAGALTVLDAAEMGHMKTRQVHLIFQAQVRRRGLED
jgi:hypothetical protein